MRNNKGYSLVELLISIAIFSLVMGGIISIMNTTSVFYRGGQQEVRLQEEAQIAINQIEELLIDLDNKKIPENIDYDKISVLIEDYEKKQTFFFN